MNWWRVGEATFFGGTTFALWGLISGQKILQFFGMGMVIFSYPFLLAGAAEDEK